MKITDNLSIGTNYTQYKKDEAQAENFKNVLEKAKENKEEAKLMETCKQLESVLVNMMFKTMRSTVQSDGFIPKGFERETFEGMFDEKVADEMSKGQGIGLAQQLYKQLSRNLKAVSLEGPQQEE